MVHEYETFGEVFGALQQHDCPGKRLSAKSDLGKTAEESFIGFSCACGDDFVVRVSSMVKEESSCPLIKALRR